MSIYLSRLLLLVFVMIFTIPSYSSEHSLGKIAFKVSNNALSQHQFEQGLLLLHSFEYNQARDYFKQAEVSDQTNFMAYWGEAMTYNHPVWNEQDLQKARSVLAKLDSKKISLLPKQNREFIAAIRVLYGPGSKHERDLAYANKMAELFKQSPQDDEIATFYALSLLGSTEKERDFAIYMKAAGILEEVFARNPLHPGAAHYLIHCYDDAIHAPLGLRPARVYAKIAPAASHALHMPSHIFLALGLWDDLIASNINAWESGKTHRQACEHKRCDDPISLNNFGDDLHALMWLAYGYLQKQDNDKAYQATLAAYQLMQSQPSATTRWYYVLMRAAYLSESENWQANLPAVDVSDMALSIRANDFYVNSMIAYHRGEDYTRLNARIESFANSIPDKIAQMTTPASYYTAITPTGISIAKMAVLEVKALLKLHQGETKLAIAMLQRAAEMQDTMPLAYGPPFPVKPPHELLAQVLSQNKSYGQAYSEYERALKLAPQRKISLLGLQHLSQLH